MAIAAYAGDVVAALVVLIQGGRALGGGTHTELVVLNHVDHRQVPQSRHVHRLVDLALVGRTVAAEAERDVVAARLAVVLEGEGVTGGSGALRTHDAVASEEAIVRVVHVHGAALALAAAGVLAHQLSKDSLDAADTLVARADDLPGVAAVGGGHGVGLRDRRLHTHADGLLAVVQVAEAADLLLLVQVVVDDLHAPGQGHGFEVLRASKSETAKV